MHKITILLFISRNDYLQRFITSIELLECRHEFVNVLAIVDGDINLFTDVRNAIEFTKYNQRLTLQYPSSDDKSNYNVLKRRQRISDLHNYSKQFISDIYSDFIMVVEDDTIVPTSALYKLHQHYITYPHAGFIQGIEVGRWGVPYLGAWKLDDIYNTKKISSTKLYTDLQEIDAGGFYCFMTKTDTYLNHEFKTFENNSLGPDVDFGITLRRQGLMNYTDYSIACKHLTNNGEITVNNQQIEEIDFNLENNRWVLSRQL